LGKKIKERMTPDLPQLNSGQEAMVICQLGATIFGELLKIESNESDEPNE
jgi:hypothetical protein